MQKKQLPAGYRCHATSHGSVQVFNQNSYLMGEYNENSGVVSWKRVVLAAQKAAIELWLSEEYPVKIKKKTRQAA
ncbi:MAG: hypothetical protein ABIZ80_06625 [Bryobacteraceae bacterium]